MRPARYPRYRATGSKWLDAVPNHWRVEKLKFVAHAQASNVDKHSHDNEIPVRLCNYSDIYNNKRITDDLPFMAATASKKEIEKFVLRAGDVIITKDSESWDDIAVPAYVPESIDGVLCGYHLSQIRSHSNEVNGAYLYYLLKSETMNRQFQVSANGVTRFGLPGYNVDNAMLVIPPLDEQQTIVRFLDVRTAKIDELMAKKQRLLQSLAEKRTAIITQIVTKGVDSDAPMKESGVQWLGTVPAHWTLVPLKWRCTIKGGQVDPADPEFRDLPLIAPDHIESGTGRLLPYESADEQGATSGKYHFRKGCLLYSKIRPELSKACIAPVDGLCSADMYAIEPNHDLAVDFLLYQFLSKHFHQFAVVESMRVAMPKVNREALGSFPLLIPPVEEQIIIVANIRKRLAEIDSLVSKIQAHMRALDEYRSALITSAVIGQIDVRIHEQDLAAQ